jgi:hypothetical protein
MGESSEPPRINFAGSVYGQVNVNSPNSQQYLALTGEQGQSFRHAIEELRQSVAQMNLSPDAARMVRDELDALEQALTGDRPSPSLVQRIYTRICDVAGGAVANLVASLLSTHVPWINLSG